MQYKTELPWMKINDFLLIVGRERTSQGLCTSILYEIAGLIPYDIGALFLLDETGKSYKQILIEMEPKWSKAYIDYYSKIEEGRFSYFIDKPDEKDWSDYRNSEIATDYMAPQRIRHSATLKLYSSDHFLRGAIGLNRSCSSGFTQSEKEILSVLRPHLSNLHKNLFVAGCENKSCDPSGDEAKHLTGRETQITDLLCKGLSPGQISKKYFISQRTVYKHLENIYQKLGVSTRQELLVKLLNKN